MKRGDFRAKYSFYFSLFYFFIMSQTLHSQTFNFDEVTYTPEKTTFRLFAPKNCKSVRVQLYNVGEGSKAVKTVRMKKIPHQVRDEENSIWTAVVRGDLKGKFYTFDIGKGECPGVFAKAVGVNGRRGAVLDLRETDPEGWDDDSRPWRESDKTLSMSLPPQTADYRPVANSPADLIVYEMHHRDFSIDSSSGLRHKGKFLALTEEKAINHLKELGVNAIHILPSYDFGSVDETRLQDNKYNWGYDPVNYNVPEGSYSTDPYDPLCRIREFKQMVLALHKAGIRVILDVVYNHTYDIENSNFQKTCPDYFYRKVYTNDSPDEDWVYSNGSGCGNETASEKPMMRQFMIESVKYWINEYHIDGFRFDLMGVHDIETMNAIRKTVDEIDPAIFIYGEGWSAGSCALPAEQLGVKANIPKMPRIAAFSDEIRDALRGPFSDDAKGAFLAGIAGEEESLKYGIVGAIAHPQVDMTKVNYSKEPWADEPTQMISYVSCHDDMCLVDRLKTSIPALKEDSRLDELIRLDLLAQTAVFTSQGVPFMLSGEEMLRDKKGVHNSFESPDSINHLDWQNLERYPQVFEYYKNLIALRKHHPAFRLGSAELVRKHLEFLPSVAEINDSDDVKEGCLVAFRLKNHAGGDAWKDIIVILNANREPRVVEIPEGHYVEVCCNGVINEDGLGEITGGKVSVDAQSALIIHN